LSEKIRKERLNSPQYRELLGKKLFGKRIELNYSRLDISLMTTIPENTINSIEKGITTNIDYYVEYGKAVKYPLQTLLDFKIPLKPKNDLPKERKDAIKLTAKVREHIVNTDFLSDGKVVADIKEQLLKLKLIPKDLKSEDISGVMRNLKDDGLVTTGKKVGRKVVYFKFEK